jgi:hypothetical protein
MNGEPDDNLFRALFTYCPRPNRVPLEDFCTEALAWCLRNSPDFNKRFLRLTGLAPLIRCGGGVSINTQAIFSISGSGRGIPEASAEAGRLDLVIESLFGEPFVLLIECKVVPCSMYQQLKKYRGYLNRQYAHLPETRRFLVTLTDLPIENDDLDARLRWEAVQPLLKTARDKSLFVQMALQQFAVFLETKGLAPMQLPQLTDKLLRNWIEVKQFEKSLTTIIRKLQNKEEIRRITSGRQVKRGDEHWIGISGDHCFWAGFCIQRAEVYMWVEITLPGDRRELRRSLKGEFAAAFREATRYFYRDWPRDKEAVNLAAPGARNGNLTMKGNSRFVFARPVCGERDEAEVSTFQWLYDTSLKAIHLGSPVRTKSRLRK